MQHYVAGFAFLGTPPMVYMVRKTHPVQLAGRWNAVGGKVDAGETHTEAMLREFREETGVSVTGWQRFCQLRGSYPLDGKQATNFVVSFYYTTVEPAVGLELSRRDVNDVGEELRWVPWARAVDPNWSLPNCSWLLPMACSFAYGERAAGFVVEERYTVTA